MAAQDRQIEQIAYHHHHVYHHVYHPGRHHVYHPVYRHHRRYYGDDAVPAAVIGGIVGGALSNGCYFNDCGYGYGGYDNGGYGYGGYGGGGGWGGGGYRGGGVHVGGFGGGHAGGFGGGHGGGFGGGHGGPAAAHGGGADTAAAVIAERRRRAASAKGWLNLNEIRAPGGACLQQEAFAGRTSTGEGAQELKEAQDEKLSDHRRRRRGADGGRELQLVTSPNRRQASARASGTDDEIYGNANGDADGPGR